MTDAEGLRGDKEPEGAREHANWLASAAGHRVGREAEVVAEAADVGPLQRALATANQSLDNQRQELLWIRERACALEEELELRLEATRAARHASPSRDRRAWNQFRSLLASLRNRMKRQLLRVRPNPLFDADWYLLVNPDVGAAGMDPLRHYRLHGASENRDPSPFIDRDWYLQEYPDVALSGMDPLDHYYLYGAKDGRDPGPHFHAACYLAIHQDVLAAGVNPLVHYVRRGMLERRRLCDALHVATDTLTPRERYGDMLAAAISVQTGKRDVVWFGVIDWEYRVQRPQHLASDFADAGHRVVYVSPHFDPADGRGAFTLVSQPRDGVFQVRLKLPPPARSVYSGLDERETTQAIAAFSTCAAALSLREPVAVLDLPAWRLVALSLPGAVLVMDCLDHVAGFSNVGTNVIADEAKLVSQADVVVASSQRLADSLGRIRPTVLIRNGADIGLFGANPAATPSAKANATVGYFGAIAEWFEVEWVAMAATEHPEWDFVLIGRHDGCDTSPLETLTNVQLLGEQPYEELPPFLNRFDVAIIPFQLTELILSTNPVKLYEYLSAGVPVVASAMPEVLDLEDGLVYVARDSQDFVRNIERALRDDSRQRRALRREWAAQHDWAKRGEAFRDAVAAASPRVSVVILCHNNWSYTEACLASVLQLSAYPEDLLEVIVVDNASTDETHAKLMNLQEAGGRVRVVHNSQNLGFAGGNNVGIRQSSGEIVVLLNNDTYVTQGWIQRLIRPIMRGERVGLCGPITNNIGNEQRVALYYQGMDEMQRVARRFVDRRLGETFETDNLAFFCVAIHRDVLDDVGLLDEEFGMGFFEDDDYCRRASSRGWRMVIADDVFVHHRLSASFDAMAAETRRGLFERNRRVFEQRWGPWSGHQHRAGDGFGA